MMPGSPATSTGLMRDVADDLALAGRRPARPRGRPIARSASTSLASTGREGGGHERGDGRCIFRLQASSRGLDGHQISLAAAAPVAVGRHALVRTERLKDARRMDHGRPAINPHREQGMLATHPLEGAVVRVRRSDTTARQSRHQLAAGATGGHRGRWLWSRPRCRRGRAVHGQGHSVRQVQAAQPAQHGRPRAGRRTAPTTTPWACRADDIARPFVGVVTTWNEAAPCNIALGRQAQAAKRGVAKAGGTPREFTTITVTDGIAMGHQGMKSVAGQPRGDRQFGRAHRARPRLRRAGRPRRLRQVAARADDGHGAAQRAVGRSSMAARSCRANAGPRRHRAGRVRGRGQARRRRDERRGARRSGAARLPVGRLLRRPVHRQHHGLRRPRRSAWPCRARPARPRPTRRATSGPRSRARR